MKKMFGILAVIMMVVIALPTMSYAVSETEQETVAESSVDEATLTEKKQDREERVKVYKDKAQEALTAAQERKVAGACKGAQTKLTNLIDNLDSTIEKRQSKYDEASLKLSDLVQKLQAALVDTAELESAIVEMNGLMATATQELNSYRVVLSDLTEIDCESDPTGFRAALTAAREQRTNASSRPQSIRVYVNETLKPLLESIKGTLQTNDDVSEES